MDKSQEEFWKEIRKELDSLKAENSLLKDQVTELKKTQQVGPELLEALGELEGDDIVPEEFRKESKTQLLGLLDELEEMIHALNTNTGMGLTVPGKVDEIRNTLKNQQ